jgi:hypothetical protein
MATRIDALQEEGTETSPDLNASPLAVASVLSSPALGKETPFFLQEEARHKLRHGQKFSIRELNAHTCEALDVLLVLFTSETPQESRC